MTVSYPPDGQVVNGHRYDAVLNQWVPVEQPAPPSNGTQRRWPFVATGAAVLVTVLVAVAVTTGGTDTPAAPTAAPSATVQPEPVPEPDADGDGVADSADYSPNDPTIQTIDDVPPNPADYRTVTERELQLIVKDPEAHAGEQIVVYAAVSQFDAATGTDQFRAQVAASTVEYWGLDGTNAIFVTAGADLSNVVEDDIVKVYATVSQSITYDTQLGGSTTAPVFVVDIIEVIGRDD